ncbi:MULTISPECIES: bifunctional diguanylate cyclase/phosphodiesterase [Micromonospora]|uniref:Bifunctional diguanylate cyclase/phosphodiesterase n=1 Tax=Micromonospora solifontis TaxID=2487138 RepID=A0ABX9WIB2_9ACTN|nr:MULTISPECIES: bifunctional diguanylate cyclase/phosphodiesterase [Micromonospora]NES12575.1 sensor domain-containing phosphodiesterase [Micromonospora sp. PPF5-17B]NES36474.1 sensor domain-containing phosphodiesterase [Micromonospora solifontis]NES54540.1 sensor domain-containing phosphodiesterase [Micromonospora sp. PPF5-6]RNL99530.1 bifunctional diguanylate cyclase/phosphodiesterase [Micromonospora solifontis]
MSGRDKPRRRSSEDAWIITAPLVLLAVTCATVTGLITDRPFGGWAPAALLLVVMLLASGPVVGVVIRRQSLGMTLTDLPLVLAFYFLPPLAVVLIYTLSSLVTHLRHRMAAPKLWFNVARAAAGTSLGALVLHALPPADGVAPYTWLGLCLAISMVILVSVTSIAAVQTLLVGWPAGRETIRALPSVALTTGINVSAGLIVLMLLNESWWSLAPLAALAAGLVVVYRSYAEFFQQHRTLTGMYELSRAISASGQDGTLADALLGRVRALLQAEYATLWLPAQGRHPETLLTARVDDPGLLDTAPTPPELRQKAVDTARPITVGRGVSSDPEFRERLAEHGVKDTVVVPLRSGRVVIGTLEVTNRLGDPLHFTQRDVAVFETVAAHAAVALENSRLVDRLRHDAEHDALTRLPNRRRLTAAVAEAVKIRAPGEVVALLLFDVDRLRQVNESLGHAAGDKVLVEVAERLRACAPSSALVGRAGGDEFLVTLRLESTEAALELAGQLREQIRDEMVFDALTLDVDTAVGVAVHPDHGSDALALLQRVDLATTAAKSVPGSVQLYSPALESRSLRRLGLAGDLRRALDDGELEVYFQPKVTLRDRRLVGVECLARWEHPAHGTVAPDDFVAVAEHTGQLGRLTEFVLRESLRRSRDWQQGGQPLAVSVNLAARTLTDQHFPSLVGELLDEYGVPPQRLTLEITEAGVLDGTERPIPTLRRLRDLGVRLSVDDFGTGNSSLAQLRRLPVHEVKVDRSFVQGMATDPGDLAIVNAVVTLSQQFGLAVVAEGVESELTLELLQDIGCEIGQGFLFSRPLPYERLEAWFAAQVDPEPVPAGELPRLRVVP